jgi:hypothetical protein
MIDFVGVGAQYFRVVANGQLWSQHTTRYKADESAYDLGVEALRQIQAGTLAAFPTIYVDAAGRVDVVPDPDNIPANIPAPPTPPTSDGGMDVVAFFDTFMDPYDPATAIILTTGALTPLQSVMYDLMSQSAERSKAPGRWLASGVFMVIDGNPVRIGATWRGYKLMLDQRDKTAIKIGVS